MKKRISDEQIISILREAEAGFSALELCRKHANAYANSYLSLAILKAVSVIRVDNVNRRAAEVDKGFFAGAALLAHGETACLFIFPKKRQKWE